MLFFKQNNFFAQNNETYQILPKLCINWLDVYEFNLEGWSRYSNYRTVLISERFIDQISLLKLHVFLSELWNYERNRNKNIRKTSILIASIENR